MGESTEILPWKYSIYDKMIELPGKLNSPAAIHLYWYYFPVQIMFVRKVYNGPP
jgi:hypothetical protein